MRRYGANRGVGNDALLAETDTRACERNGDYWVGTVNRLIVIVLFEGVDLLDVTGPPEVFSRAKPWSDWATRSCWPPRRRSR